MGQVGLCLSFFLFIGEGNGTPLQYSCLENPMTEDLGKEVLMAVTLKDSCED